MKCPNGHETKPCVEYKCERLPTVRVVAKEEPLHAETEARFAELKQRMGLA